MSEPVRTAKATLELEIQKGEGLEGALSAPDGSRRPFSGWIELAAAIEDWRQGTRSGEEPKERASEPEVRQTRAGSEG
jgi:hypothetical protein